MRKIRGLLCVKNLRKLALGSAVASSVLVAGCETAAGTGALAGGALGTGLGALLGGRCGGGAALAGGLIGAAAGGVTGAVVDAQREKKQAQAAAVAVAQRAPSLEDLVRMTQANVPDGEMIDQIRSSGAVYHLTSDQIIYLNQNGVHQPVISALQATAYQTPRRVYIAHPAPPPVVFVEPAPPPPVVGVGVTFGR